MKCPSCAAGELAHGSRDMPYTYKGKAITMANVVGGYCPACGEMVLDAGESARVSTAMLDFNKQVNGAIADPGFIAMVRKKLALDQKEAAELYRVKR